ncbi:hypothetical protein HHI36_019090 [Cryptolaemus montrouzieri]|uniref:Uncharacterized protein n=1 Tax=Cryptolaemus montrouzieri TaxID=559131 RepID=A0ABD2P246_9CUCU
MSKKQSHNSRPDGEYVEAPRPRFPKQLPQGPLSRKVWGASADELLLDSMDLISELIQTWEGRNGPNYDYEDGYGFDSSTEEEYENVRNVSGRRK